MSAEQMREDFAAMASRLWFLDPDYMGTTSVAKIAEFDRWLAAHDAQAWDEGYEAGIHAPLPISTDGPNPYRADAMTRQADAPGADEQIVGEWTDEEVKRLTPAADDEGGRE